MKKKTISLIILIGIFVLLLSTSLYVSFSSNIDVQEIVVKNITPIYDENSTIEVDNNNVVFNDKNQVVKYNVVLENTQDYDVEVSDIKLSTPSEEFLKYETEDLENKVIKANSTKELIVSFETMGIKGWGRNFQDELTANISFEKVVKQEEVTNPKEDNEEILPPKEEVKVPEKPAQSIQEVVNKAEKIEVTKITNNIIEFKNDVKVEKGQKIAVWIYSEPIFLGYFDVVETNGVKQIVGLEEALKDIEIKSGKHHIVLATDDNETIGYVEVYLSENNTLSQEKPEDDGKLENPYTSDKGLFVVLIIATGVTGLAIVMVSKNKFAKYTMLVLMLSPVFTITNAEEVIEVAIKNNVSFESQNVMKPSGWDIDVETISINKTGIDFWAYAMQIKNFYIQNEITEIDEYVYEFDVTEEQNGRVMAYLVNSESDSVCYDIDYNTINCYDLYLQADGIIYPNKNMDYYFAMMLNLNNINNLGGIDTSEVTSMFGTFGGFDSFAQEISLDLSNFDTSEVTNMSYMFYRTGYMDENFTLDVSNFNTSKVTDMSGMFAQTGYNSSDFTLDVSKFDTSKVTDMSHMFEHIGINNTDFTLDVSNFDTGNVTDMSYMFAGAGYNSSDFTLDVSNFDTSKVTDMSYMFYNTGMNSTKINLSITISNPNINTNSYLNMFSGVGTLMDSTQIKLNYTEETDFLVAEMVKKLSDSNVAIGDCINCSSGYVPIGTEIDINGEKFNVISQTKDTIKLFAQYNLGTDYRQNAEKNGVKFSDENGWTSTPRPKDLDIQTWSPNLKTYVNAYVEYLKEELGDDSVTGDLISLRELDALGCTVPSDYYYDSGGWNCNDSPYGWIVIDQYWWTHSVANTDAIWSVYNDGRCLTHLHTRSRGVRPVITISKSSL